MEKIASEPDFFLDGAHNEDAVRMLRNTLDLIFPDRKIVYIMGVLADKEYDRMIRIMFREGDHVFTVTPPNPRALSAKLLVRQMEKQGIRGTACDGSGEAVSRALEEVGTEDVILAFGSLSYLGEIRSIMTNRKDNS